MVIFYLDVSKEGRKRGPFKLLYMQKWVGYDVNKGKNSRWLSQGVRARGWGKARFCRRFDDRVSDNLMIILCIRWF